MIIDKFPFSTDGNATDVGDLTVSRMVAAGQSSTTHGYTSGRLQVWINIDKFSFSADGNATDVGDLVQVDHECTQVKVQQLMVILLGDTPWAQSHDKFTFSTDANATDVGDLSVSEEAPQVKVQQLMVISLGTDPPGI